MILNLNLSIKDNEEIITLNLYCDFTQYAFENNKKPAVFEGQKNIIYKVNFKVQSSISLEELIVKGISNFNEYFKESKIPLRLKEYNNTKIKWAFSLKPSKKNGLPKTDFPSKLFFKHFLIKKIVLFVFSWLGLIYACLSYKSKYTIIFTLLFFINLILI